jgi:RHS repeat-associated protein
VIYDYFYDAQKKHYTLIEKLPGGRMVESVINLNGETVERYENGKLMTKTVIDGNRRITTNEQGQKTIREYDAFKNLIKITKPDDTTESWRYNAQGDVTLYTDVNGVQTESVYENGHLIRRIEAKGTPAERITEYDYDEWANRTVIRQPATQTAAESVRTYTYDALGNTQSYTDAEGNTTTYHDHDALGNAARVVDPQNHTWRSEYDPAGNLLKSYTPQGWAADPKRFTRYDYDKDGRLVQVTTPAGQSTRYSYDARNHVRSVTDPNGKTTLTERNYAGQVIRHQDPTGKKVQLTYDTRGRLKTQVDGRNNTITLNYIEDGSMPSSRPATIDYPTFQRRFEYDTSQRVKRIVDEADGQSRVSAEFTYTKTGQRESVIDAEGKTTNYHYDLLGRLEKIIDPKAQTTRFEYDSRDNLTAVIDPKGSRTQYHYDRDNRQTQEIRPMGEQYSFHYDSRGALEWMTDPKGNKTVYDYTPDGQLEQQVRYAAGQLQQPETTITYAYHRSGQLASYSDGTHGASYAYTATGQLQSETTQFGPFSKSVAYGYHDNGDLKHYTDPEGRTLEYHYDANRQLEAITLPNVGLYTVNSHRWFAPEQVTLPGGSVQKRSYDGFMQLTGIEVKDPGQNRQMHYQYAYDKVGNITGKATEHGAYVYQYDDLYRLIEAQNPNSDTETFTYDPVGNRLTTQASPTPWIYNANHALQSRPEAISYGYDANGSTTQIIRNGQTTHLIYNAANRLAEIKDHANQSVATYRYDPFGRRISKTVHGDTTYFLYSPQGLIGEYTATGSLIRGYGYKPGGHWMTDPLYLKTGNAREQHYFYQNDHLGTPQKLMSTTGAIVWDARYEAFGKATPAPLFPEVSPEHNPLRFAGQYHDPETGWHYNWHRYYAPELGRYITSDPIGLEGGLNTYAYVGGNPLRLIDPHGLSFWESTQQAACRAAVTILGTAAYGVSGMVAGCAAGGLAGAGNGAIICLPSGPGAGVCATGGAIAGCAGVGLAGGVVGAQYGFEQGQQAADNVCTTEDDECSKLYSKIDSLVNELKRRYYELLEDKRGLPASGPMSILGHQQQFRNKQTQLRNLLNQADTKGCKAYNTEAWHWATIPTPAPLPKISSSGGGICNG